MNSPNAKSGHKTFVPALFYLVPDYIQKTQLPVKVVFKEANEGNELVIAQITAFNHPKMDDIGLYTVVSGTLQFIDHRCVQVVTNKNRFAPLQQKRLFNQRGIRLESDVQLPLSIYNRFDYQITMMAHAGYYPLRQFGAYFHYQLSYHTLINRD